MTKILNMFNPCGTGMDPTADPRVQQFYLDRHPGCSQTVVMLSPADCSVASPSSVKESRDAIKRYDEKPGLARMFADHLLASFDPIKTVETLLERGTSTDFDGIIAADHEVPAWMSSLHFAVYHRIRNAVKAVFPRADFVEYAGLRTDFVIAHSMPHRMHELRVMDRMCGGTKLGYLPHLYVPGAEYLKGLTGFRKNVEGNIKRWRSANADFPAIAVNPFIEHTEKAEGDYTSGDLVPVEAMTIVVKAIIDAGAAIADRKSIV